MKQEEKNALQFLRNLGFEKIEYEPDGNIPPDFLINNEIAVEVRRLNQFISTKDKIDPIEKLEFTLQPKIKSILKEYKNSKVNNSAFISYHYTRPLKVKRDFFTEIRRVLTGHLEHIDKEKEVWINDNFYLKFFPIEARDEQVYMIGSIYDRDKGGRVDIEVKKSLEIILSEKENKIDPYKERYTEWWLVLVNQIYLDIDRMSATRIRDKEIDVGIFNKIYIISEIEPERGFELYSKAQP